MRLYNDMFRPLGAPYTAAEGVRRYAGVVHHREIQQGRGVGGTGDT